MKRSVAAALGVVVAGGLGFGIYAATRGPADSGGSKTNSEVLVFPQRQGHTDRPRLVPRAKESPRSALDGRVASGIAPTASSVETAAAPAAVADPVAAGSGRTTAAAAQPDHRSFKVRPMTPADDSPEAMHQRMNRTFEQAACRVPGIEDRLRKLDDAGRAKLKARCAKVGVTLDPK